MNKPNNYDVTPDGNFEPIELGGHIIVIKRVKEAMSRSNRPMLVVAFDFAPNDTQPGYFTKSFEADIRPDKKWPHAGTSWILIEGNDGNCTKNFKSFISCFEKSNNCVAVWGDNFAAQFTNKVIGGVYGEVESSYNGKTSIRHELRWFCEAEKAKTAAVPDFKPLSSSGKTASAPEGCIPDDSIPF